MTKRKTYYKCKFSIEIIKSAHDTFLSFLNNKEAIGNPTSLNVEKNNEEWDYDSLEEFLVACKDSDRFRLDHMEQKKRIIISGNKDYVYVLVSSDQRSEIEKIFEIFERKLDESIIKIEKQAIKIFIGHGQNNLWKDLKDHLHEKHGFDVVAYEIGPRAGLSIKEVLEKMLEESSIAFLVLTAEDIDTQGVAHARENVIHELGLFQGKVGFTKAIAMLEKGVNEFSNIFGVNQIRFSEGNIQESFGEVLAVIKREFVSN